MRKWLTSKTVNYFRKTLHFRYLLGFWIHLWLWYLSELKIRSQFLIWHELVYLNQCHFIDVQKTCEKYWYEIFQERNKDTLSVAFEVLLINCQTCFKNFSSFNSLTSNFVFRKIYDSQAKEKGCYGRVSLVLVIKCKPENDDLFEAWSNKVLRHRTLCTNILKC